MSNQEFSHLDLRPELMQAISDLGYAVATPIQSAVVPVMLAGRDVIGQSQTGSGKTAAFGLPVLQRLARGQRHVQSLIVTPTRELALQVAEAMEQLGGHMKARVLAVYGGQPYPPQNDRLKKGIDVVVGTPGRLLDLMEKRVLDLSRVSTVILDEADEMLSMGFIKDIEALLEAAPADRQTALFSATLPPAIRSLAKRYLNDPHSCTVDRQQLTVATVEQRYYLINENDRCAALTRLFEMEPMTSALVFARTRLSTAELVNELVGRGFAAEMLTGELSQETRERVLQRFRNHQVKVLVATDVAARGLDIEDISHVFNYDLPQDPEVYVHRIGRTGRAGKSGVAISLITPRERWFLRKIEGYTKQKLTLAQLPSEEEIQSRRDNLLGEQLLVWLRRGRCHRERQMVSDLTGQGFDLADIAAAAIKLVRAEDKQRPIAPISALCDDASKRKPFKGKSSAPRKSGPVPAQSHEKGMVRLILSSGKADGLNIGHVVSSLSQHANIPGSSLGKIHIDGQMTFVDVPRQLVPQVLAAGKSYRIGNQKVRITRA